MGSAAQAHALQQQQQQLQQQQAQVTPSQLQHMRNLLAERQVFLPTPLRHIMKNLTVLVCATALMACLMQQLVMMDRAYCVLLFINSAVLAVRKRRCGVISGTEVPPEANRRPVS
jgi:hypothetical protein